MNYKQLLENIESREDFIFFLHSLAKDSQDNIESWNNRDISSYLSGISSWAEDMDGYFRNMKMDIPSSVDWKFIATLLYVGKIYE